MCWWTRIRLVNVQPSITGVEELEAEVYDSIRRDMGENEEAWDVLARRPLRSRTAAPGNAARQVTIRDSAALPSSSQNLIQPHALLQRFLAQTCIGAMTGRRHAYCGDEQPSCLPLETRSHHLGEAGLLGHCWSMAVTRTAKRSQGLPSSCRGATLRPV